MSSIFTAHTCRCLLGAASDSDKYIYGGHNKLGGINPHDLLVVRVGSSIQPRPRRFLKPCARTAPTPPRAALSCVCRKNLQRCLRAVDVFVTQIPTYVANVVPILHNTVCTFSSCATRDIGRAKHSAYNPTGTFTRTFHLLGSAFELAVLETRAAIHSTLYAENGLADGVPQQP